MSQWLVSGGEDVVADGVSRRENSMSTLPVVDQRTKNVQALKVSQYKEFMAFSSCLDVSDTVERCGLQQAALIEFFNYVMRCMSRYRDKEEVWFPYVPNITSAPYHPDNM